MSEKSGDGEKQYTLLELGEGCREWQGLLKGLEVPATLQVVSVALVAAAAMREADA